MKHETRVFIPRFDPTVETRILWNELNDAFKEVLESGQFILGPKTTEFEAQLSSYLGVRHAIGVNSGTDALVIALRALGVTAGDEVITTPFSFFATAEAISLVGATPIFADIDLNTFNLDPANITKLISHKTKAVIPVHLFGHTADLSPMLELCSDAGLKLIEDCAQCLGGKYRARKTGTIGHASAISFYPTKNLGAFGDAGVIATNDDEMATQAKTLRSHGAVRKNIHESIGYNSRLDALQAAFLLVKLPYLDEWNLLRREAAARYTNNLKGIEGLITPQEAEYAFHIFHQYTIRLAKGKRDYVAKLLRMRAVSYTHLDVYKRQVTYLPEKDASLKHGTL